ncbi:MAG: c-type cytochrome domain-containing protein, partial [Rubripirellula sp.]
MQYSVRIFFSVILLTFFNQIARPSFFPNLYGAESVEESSRTDTQPTSFHRDIRPIFSRHCHGCHQGAKQLGSYVMTEFDRLLSGGESEQAAIIPGKPDESYLIELITPVNGHAEMPNEPFPALNQVEINSIRKWITEGAINDSPTEDHSFTTDNPPPYASAPSVPSIDTSPDGKTIAVAGYHEVLLMDA